MPNKPEFNIHLVSDATGETVQSAARACLVQFEESIPREHIWTLVRSVSQIDAVVSGIEENPGLVLYTIVDKKLITVLQNACHKLQLPCISVLQPIMGALGNYLKTKGLSKPGLQHSLDAEYFDRITALDYAMSHDDGQGILDINNADVVLVGVSRTSKTPTCIYLANRGIKAANIPIVIDIEPPIELFSIKGPLIVGLNNTARNLEEVRRNRLKSINDSDDSPYVDPELIAREVTFARRLFAKQSWPVVDMSRRSIEETAAEILKLLAAYREEKSVQPA